MKLALLGSFSEDDFPFGIISDGYFFSDNYVVFVKINYDHSVFPFPCAFALCSLESLASQKAENNKNPTLVLRAPA
jgi:hypothetical protein